MKTFFAPAERTERRKFRNQIEFISHNPIVDTLLTTMAGMLLILNEDRQVVAVNHDYLEMIGIKDPTKLLGLRMGETLHCINALKPPNGCGTTPECSSCGAAIAMLTAITENQTSEETCSLTSEAGTDFFLLIRVQPVTLEAQRWLMVYAQDISKQHFWTNLEKVFFHDISNLLTTLNLTSDLLVDSSGQNSRIVQLRDGLRRLSSEVAIQRSLSQEMDSQYLLNNANISLAEVRRELEVYLAGLETEAGSNLSQTWPSQDVSFTGDIILITRVIGNMLVNAREASPQNHNFSLTVQVNKRQITWEVWNQGFIPENLHQRIFQRHFSTKAKIGRGLGTYSMKLFGEKYLGGKVDFSSRRDSGTTFRFTLPIN